MAVLTPRDASAWHRLGQRMAPVIERSLDRGVLANRRSGSVRRDLAVANRWAGDLMERSPVVLRTDVASFYGSVTPTVLAECLLWAGADPTDARRAADMLEGWGSEGYPGLPIGPPASGSMANAVLRPADAALSGFLRWVDDYLVGVASERAALEAIDRIDCAFERLGLERSEGKTAVLEGGRSRRWPGALSFRERSC